MSELQLNFNLYNSIILAGLVQGLIFGIIVFLSPKYKVTSTRFLAGLIIAFSLNNLSYYIFDIWLISKQDFFLYYYFPNALLSPALMYFYVKTYLNPEVNLQKREYLLFIPFLVFLFALITYRIAFFSKYENSAFYDFMQALPMIAEFIGLIFTQIVLVYLYRKIIISERLSDSEHGLQGLTWLKWILISMLVLTIVWAYELVMVTLTGADRAFYMLWIGMSVMIYWLGHIGIYKFGVQQQRKALRSYSIKTQMTPVISKERNEHIVSIEKLIIGEKRYLDATITLDCIAEELHLSKSHLSRLINSDLGVSFPDYINALRVEEAKQYLSRSEFANYTLVAIGLEAGFNSKTTFNNAFKKCTGLTPSQFKNSITSADNC